MRPGIQNTLTCQPNSTNEGPRDPLHGPITHWHLTLNSIHWWRTLSWRIHQHQLDSFFNSQPKYTSYLYQYIKLCDDVKKEFPFRFCLFGSIHSSIFQRIWNFQSFQFSFDFHFFMSSSLFCASLLNIGLSIGEVLDLSLLVYHFNPISVNISCVLFLWSSTLRSGMVTGIFLKNYSTLLQ